MARPTNWAKWIGTAVEPSDAKKIEGWLDGEEPPHTYFNWWMGAVYTVLDWIRTKVPAVDEAWAWTGKQTFAAVDIGGAIGGAGQMSNIAMLPTANVVTSASGSGLATTASTGAWVDCPNMSAVTITTHGRPVILALVSEDPASDAIPDFWASKAGAMVGGYLRLVRDATVIDLASVFDGSGENPAQQPHVPVPGPFIDTPAAGAHTYKVQLKANGTGGASTLGLYSAKLRAIEL